MCASVLILGAGPGGLSTALALHRRGVSVKLLERAPALHVGGSGIMLAVNAMRVFRLLEVEAALRESGAPLLQGQFQDHKGSLLQEMPMNEAAKGYSLTGIGIHRRELSRILAEALPPEVLRCGVQVRRIEEHAAGIRLHLDGEVVEGELLVGADGIHSQVRDHLWGPQPLRYSGATCWRGISEIADPVGPGVFVERWGPAGLRFGPVPISAEYSYWFATANTAADGRDGDDPRAEMVRRFSEFAAPVPQLLAATSKIIRRDLWDLQPLRTWTRGRITLLGDAAHAMTPNMGQGACQAIEDAVILADALASGGAGPQALLDYESRRRPRAREFVDRSWTLGQVATWTHPVARWLRNSALCHFMPRALQTRALEKIYGFDLPQIQA